MEEGYEFFAKRQLVTIFSAPNYCGEFENAGAMMSVDDTLMCSFQVGLGGVALSFRGGGEGGVEGGKRQACGEKGLGLVTAPTGRQQQLTHLSSLVSHSPRTDPEAGREEAKSGQLRRRILMGRGCAAMMR